MTIYSRFTPGPRGRLFGDGFANHAARSFPTLWQQVLRYVADRTGIISFANFPLIWLFGMRNNVVIWLTGWDFGTYNNFHRWVARVATLQAVVHSVAYTWLILKGALNVTDGFCLIWC
jgi:hypothetical protein